MTWGWYGEFTPCSIQIFIPNSSLYNAAFSCIKMCSFEYSKVINSELLFKVSGSHQEGQYDSWVLLHHRQQLHGFCVCLLIRPLISMAFFLLLCVCL